MGQFIYLLKKHPQPYQQIPPSMKVISLHVLKWAGNEKAWILCNAYQLDFLSFWQRPFFKQHLHFGARTAAARTTPGQNVCIRLAEDEKCLVYCAVKEGGIAAVLIADTEYPEKVAIKACHDIIKIFEQSFGAGVADGVKEDTDFKFPKLEE